MGGGEQYIDAVLDSDTKKNNTKFNDKLKIQIPDTFDFDSVQIIIITIFDNEESEKIKKSLCEKYKNKNLQNKIVIFKDFLRKPEWPLNEQYFDNTIIHLNEKESFVDAGVWDLGTSIIFGEKCRQKGIRDYHSFAFEPDNINYERCKKIQQTQMLDFISLIHAGLWNENGIQRFNGMGNGGSSVSNRGYEAQMFALDHYNFDRKVTFIKMDIEGAELSALKGGSGLIKTEKPKLAICIYHKSEDLTDIPIFIKELVPEYKFYIRHYSNTDCETVLYAVNNGNND